MKRCGLKINCVKAMEISKISLKRNVIVLN